jgi:hypothetical protein
MFTVIHIYGGLINSVSSHFTIDDAAQRMHMFIPDHCDCAGDCDSYQEAILFESRPGIYEDLEIDALHSPSK